MKPFMDADFLLQTDTAKVLYHEAAEKMPIFDYHTHQNPQQILDDVQMDNLTKVWLGGDHYKWRAMRAMGFSEELITGSAPDYDKYLAYAETIENSIGNPLYHWTHLELQRYFGITKPLCLANAKEIWDEANAKLQTKEFSVRNLILGQHVAYLCTTDDPIDDLHCHIALKKENFACPVLPSFRPDKAINIEKPDFVEYVEKLAEAANTTITSADTMLDALAKRLDHFVNAGCAVSDHSLEGTFYVPATSEEANAIFKKRLEGGALTDSELGQYKGYILVGLAAMYTDKNIAMQLHIKALRNNSTRMFRLLGPDTGYDSMNDFAYAPMLSGLLDAMDLSDKLPKTILYSQDPMDNWMLATMAGNFQGGGIKGKVQFGTAWWMNDHKPGMEAQMTTLASVGVLPTFIGMLTDSRSFLSFSRHEYFRRILCNLVGGWVENGEYPAHMDVLKKMIEDISFNNAVNYLLK